MQDLIAAAFVSSDAAAGVVSEAHRLGLGEVRLYAVSPFLTLIVDRGAMPVLAHLAAYAGVAAGATVYVVALGSIPPARRAAAWRHAQPLIASMTPDGPTDEPR